MTHDNDNVRESGCPLVLVVEDEVLLRVMTVEVGGQVFGIPIDAVIETIRVPRDRISRAGAASVIVLRDRTLPLIPLADRNPIALRTHVATVSASLRHGMTTVSSTFSSPSRSADRPQRPSLVAHRISVDGDERAPPAVGSWSGVISPAQEGTA